MKRAGIFLLAVCVVLATGGLARAASGIGGERFQASSPADPPVLSFSVYLPLVMHQSAPGSWVTIVEEGFESEPGSLWGFWDANGVTGGAYYWARRDCRSYSGSYSAWAVGGGADGASLDCASNYPDNVNSWMAYGPFSLADATAAELRFRFWLYRGDAYDRDDFCWSAGSSTTELLNNELCLTYDTGAWSPMTLDLGDSSAINLLGRPQVWIAFRFTSYGNGLQAEGAYVDDVVIRKCLGGMCPASSGSVSVAAAGRAGRSVSSLPATRSSKFY